MPGPVVELVTVLFIAGSTMVVPAIIIFLIVRAWGASQRRQDEQIRLLSEIAQSIEQIGKRVEALETQTTHDGRKDVAK